MYQSICPICHLTFPAVELERHANSHFEDEEFARDMELAQDIALAPPSPFIMTNRMENNMPCETSDKKIHGSSNLRFGGRTNNGGESEDDGIDEKICYLIGLQIRASFYKVEAGLIALLRKCLELDSETTSILSGYVDHFESINSEDVGWGCGWRNIQMLSSHLLMQRQDTSEVLFCGARYVPDIASLQRWLEIAWERGFDVLGASHFDRKIYGKNNWIGTTECAALFRSFGLRARIVDFDSKNITAISSAPSSRHVSLGENTYGPMDKYLSRGDPKIQGKSSYSGICARNDVGTSTGSSEVRRSIKGYQVLIDWVWNYFSDNKLSKLCSTRVIVSDKAPLYFQHNGHSRTIVGVQVKRHFKGTPQYNLLILDPAHRTSALERSLKENIGWQKQIKRGVHTLKKPQYQLCYIVPGIACGEEMEQLKTLDSVYVEI